MFSLSDDVFLPSLRIRQPVTDVSSISSFILHSAHNSHLLQLLLAVSQVLLMIATTAIEPGSCVIVVCGFYCRRPAIVIDVVVVKANVYFLLTNEFCRLNLTSLDPDHCDILNNPAFLLGSDCSGIPSPILCNSDDTFLAIPAVTVSLPTPPHSVSGLVIPALVVPTFCYLPQDIDVAITSLISALNAARLDDDEDVMLHVISRLCRA